jgi:hypothetical protein
VDSPGALVAHCAVPIAAAAGEGGETCGIRGVKRITNAAVGKG